MRNYREHDELLCLSFNSGERCAAFITITTTGIFMVPSVSVNSDKLVNSDNFNEGRRG